MLSVLFFLSCLIAWHLVLLNARKQDIVRENLLPGSSSWYYPQSSIPPTIQGYSTQFSFQAGDRVDFKINSLPTQLSYQLRIYRLGYYQGNGGRLIQVINVQTPTVQPPCLFDPLSRMVDCSNWNITTTWRIPRNVTTGLFIALPVYQPTTSTSLAYGSYIPFVIRRSFSAFTKRSNNHQSTFSPLAKSDILFKTSDLTWVAYNKFGSFNVYRGNGSFDFASRASIASYNRPFNNRLYKPNGQYENFFLSSEFAMLYWLEKHGYDVSYISCNDLEQYYHHRHILLSFRICIMLIKYF